ncbi:unnamed protein product [Candidula unifasciata]|uniref:Sulfotransferase domain-containing protein n=1 Tax=Candidula unifasciata TaxID=100452 RepID=A0A8S3ZCT6_9EUPU|nr:unnamed protein product [Candidula unifasciata]
MVNIVLATFTSQISTWYPFSGWIDLAARSFYKDNLSRFHWNLHAGKRASRFHTVTAQRDSDTYVCSQINDEILNNLSFVYFSVQTNSCLDMERKDAGPDLKLPLRRYSGLEGLDLQNIEGVNYFKFTLGQDLKHLLDLVRNLNIRPDDVITVGFPRSGNHWTFEMVSMILSQTTNFEHDHFYSRLIECLGSNVASTVEGIKSPRNMTTHCRMHHIPEQAIEKRIKLIYVLRNPKDVLVSMYNFVSNLQYEGSRFTGSWNEFFDLQMRGEFPWGYWFDHVLATERFQVKHPDSPLFILVYEKVKEHAVEEIQKLCAFLDMPDVLSEKIAGKTEFSKMKVELGDTKMAIQSSNHFRNGPGDILRKGIVGDWKNWFTVAQNEAFDKLFEEKMSGSKLGDLVRQYIK